MAITTQFDVGDEVRCSVTFTDAIAKTPADANVEFKVKTPSGVETTYTYGVDANVVRDGVGQYHADVFINESGTWYFRFVASGALRAAVERARDVRETHFADPL
jgi:hypothetical protein